MATIAEPISTAETSRKGPRQIRRRRRGKLVVPQIVMFGIAASTLYPLFFLATTALKSPVEYADNKLGLPRSLAWSNFAAVWDRAEIGHFALNSAIVVCVSVAFIVLLATMAGYAFGSIRPRFGSGGLFAVVALMMLPPSVLLVPTVDVLQHMGLRSNFLGLILVYTAQQLPFSIYLMSSAFQSVPRELLQAARVDGAGWFRSFWWIALPLVRQTMLALVVLMFVFLWNELLFALVLLTDPSHRTLMVGLALLSGTYGNLPAPYAAAGAVFALIPVLAIYFAFQRQLVRGLTSGSLR